MPTLSPSLDEIVSVAKDLPELVAQLEVYEPKIADRLMGRSLLASRTCWGAAGAMVLGQLSTRFALGWDQQTCSLFSGALVLVVLAGIQLIYHKPIKYSDSDPGDPGAVLIKVSTPKGPGPSALP